MSPEAIISLTAAISIGFRYLEPIHHNMQTAQNLQEQRLLDFDKIVSACKWIIQQVGRPKYLDSIWNLWSQLSESMFTLERTLWPTQPPETELHIRLPPQPRPLSDVLLDNFDEYAAYAPQPLILLSDFINGSCRCTTLSSMRSSTICYRIQFFFSEPLNRCYARSSAPSPRCRNRQPLL